MGMYDAAQARTGGPKAENSPKESEQLADEEDREEHSDNAVKDIHIRQAAHHRSKADYHDAQAALHEKQSAYHLREADYHDGKAK